ncbi:hypothetical protein ACELLULO517_16415 [Acidisoma cellulosilytica]|uniref:Lipoprotein n=1 Tax=Acidisoma cellulosilyticum TaxID=2802395 RepID=A0A963Z2U5_9PROT|nr:hypothetical protein [Acidisoma cellulosilyticum]MCB8881833.1 hypothetical protein [Acidisoma cellulosilyticum]
MNARRFGFFLPGIPLLLGGCSMVGPISGAVAGGATGAVTVNPIVGYATAVGVNAGVDELQKYIARVRQNAEQDAILLSVSEMQPGQIKDWKIVHKIPMFDNEQGTVQVTRDIDNPLTDCKEVLFTVDKGQGAHLKQTAYVTSACRDDVTWKWAESEPAVARWGYFQHISH